MFIHNHLDECKKIVLSSQKRDMFSHHKIQYIYNYQNSCPWVSQWWNSKSADGTTFWYDYQDPGSWWRLLNYQSWYSFLSLWALIDAGAFMDASQSSNNLHHMIPQFVIVSLDVSATPKFLLFYLVGWSRLQHKLWNSITFLRRFHSLSRENNITNACSARFRIEHSEEKAWQKEGWYE